ncbi:hypothetical protein TNCV_4534691 [Trichonephila clavipes]|nr:hypothetical protein TNCV_4534691 [Trichonephila clavipes]
MTEQNLIEHIINRLEPQVLDYVDVRNPTTRSQLLRVVSKFEERYLARETQSSSNNNSERQDWDERRRSLDDRRNRNWRYLIVEMTGRILIKVHTEIDHSETCESRVR